MIATTLFEIKRISRWIVPPQFQGFPNSYEQLRDIHRNPPRLIFGEQLAPADDRAAMDGAAWLPVRLSWRREKSKVESSEHQDNANIHYQPFPEPVSQEQQIYADYEDYHRRRVKHHTYLSAHFGTTFAGATDARVTRPLAQSPASP